MLGVSKGLLGELPTFEELENPKSFIATEVFAADGYLLGKYYSKNRTPVGYKDISPHLLNALIATEDARFYHHSGIDFRSMARVIIKPILTFSSGGGGSTITQQLAKNLFHARPKSTLGRIKQKFKEWFIAIKLEKSYTKNEILTMYFNTVEFTGNAFGIKSAARTFYAKHPSQLNIEEAAVLVGMLKATTLYNPHRNPEKSLNRRNTVLGQMLKYEYLTAYEFDSIKTIPLSTDYQIEDHNKGLATYFREKIRGDLKKWCKTNFKSDGSPYNLYRDGLKIYTTIDSRMQRYAEQAIEEHMSELQNDFFNHWDGHKNAPFDSELTESQIKRIIINGMRQSERYRRLKYDRKLPKDTINTIFETPVAMKVFSWKGDIDTIMSPLDSIKYAKSFLRCGFLSMESGTGHVKAWVGGINHHHFKYDHVFKGKRQVGSTFKPFVYTVAVDNGESPCLEVPDQPYTFTKGLEEPWTPKNSDGYYTGELLSLKFGLAGSINSITAYVMQKYGPEAVVNMAKKLGIKSDIKAYPSICLGTFDLSVFEMVSAYSTFSNKGIWIEPIYISRIEDKNGNLIKEFIPQKTEAISEETAYGMVRLMQGVVDGVYNPRLKHPKTGEPGVRTGTGRRIRFRYNIEGEVCGKTGTTQNNSDGWFMGYTPELINGVWVGCEDRSAHFRSTVLGQGANMALPIWGLYMQKVYNDSTLKYSPEATFKVPDQEITLELDCEKKKTSSDGGFNEFD
jgi:penicillin-binding protein 1A